MLCNLELPRGGQALPSGRLCLCYHRIRQIPSFYSGTVASNSQKNEQSPDTHRETQLWSHWPPWQSPISISYTICKAALAGQEEGFISVIPLPEDDNSSLVLGKTWLCLFRCHVSESVDNFNGSLKS